MLTDTFLSARWENLIMANYEVSPEVLIPYLPNGVELDFYRDKAYVSLVGFMFKQTRIFQIPIPFFGTFEEVNLRFYVKRKEGNSIKRGVVFINETVPYQVVAWLANSLYKEHYIAIPTKNKVEVNNTTKNIVYQWKKNGQWNHLEVTAGTGKEPMEPGSIEEFIFEHYYGYNRKNNFQSQEYKVDHPRWQTNKVLRYSIACDFTSMYGEDFSFLANLQPNSVLLAEGSPVTIKWKRTTF